MAVTVREATADDVEAWAELMTAVATEGKWIGLEAPVDQRIIRGHFVDRLGAGDAVTLLAEADGALVGTLSLHINHGIADVAMAVADGWRGQGLGTALMTAAVAWSRDRGAHKLALQHWPHNHAAHALYERFGFAEEGRLRRHWRRRNGELWDSVVMGLVLDDASPGSPHLD
ncbi:MAG: GCN5-related N-acetyltransferase [Acidimicrobiales bacterium]|jgi:RimJ/RimL family protein N-acetyltransferase|nr:GCN5-related N-acetyltransferase [Acidimicrobiales bacterium]